VSQLAMNGRDLVVAVVDQCRALVQIHVAVPGANRQQTAAIVFYFSTHRDLALSFFYPARREW